MATILLVDDDELFRITVEQMLLKLGHGVVAASNGKEALRIYDCRTTQIVLTDLIMPDMEGLELIRELRQRDPYLKLIAMSGGGRNSADVYLPIAQTLGAVQTLVKPFSIEQLAASIQAILEPA